LTRPLIAIVAVAVFVSCSSETRLGDLTLVPPEGWLVTDRQASTIKVTNGTIAEETSTHPGTATAVFDVYIDSTQTPDEFVDALEENNVEAKRERLRVDGYEATIVSYETSFFGPSTEVVFVPAWRVRVVYRAAYPDDESAFVANRPAFRKAIRSIRFEGRPPARAVEARPALRRA
jgi:hypothetical protein